MVGLADAHLCHKHRHLQMHYYLTALFLQYCKEQEKQEGEGGKIREEKRDFSSDTEPRINAKTRRIAYRNCMIHVPQTSLKFIPCSKQTAALL